MIGRDREREAEPDRRQMRQIFPGRKTIKRINESKINNKFFKLRCTTGHFSYVTSNLDRPVAKDPTFRDLLKNLWISKKWALGLYDFFPNRSLNSKLFCMLKFLIADV